MDISRRELLGGALGFALSAKAFSSPSKLDQILAKARARGWRGLLIGELVVKVGLEFLGTPYIGNTLETSDDREECIVNLEGLDCVTFYETSLAIARMVKRGQTSEYDLKSQLTTMRYRGGKLDGYLSRLHYTSDWFYDNARRGIVRDITSELPGAERMSKPFDFMSTHSNLYRQLKAHPEWVVTMAGYEEAAAKRNPFYVPKEQLRDCVGKLRSGDLIGIATSKKGLDCSHTGILLLENSRVAFLNASSRFKAVHVEPDFSAYLDGIPSDIGIMVARPE